MIRGMSVREATVEVLTAEVRVLMVGSRQVTLSVVRQLDWAESDDIVPFGRIRSGSYDVNVIEVVGSDGGGVLARSRAKRTKRTCDEHTFRDVGRCPDYYRLQAVYSKAGAKVDGPERGELIAHRR